MSGSVKLCVPLHTVSTHVHACMHVLQIHMGVVQNILHSSCVQQHMIKYLADQLLRLMLCGLADSVMFCDGCILLLQLQ